MDAAVAAAQDDWRPVMNPLARVLDKVLGGAREAEGFDAALGEAASGGDERLIGRLRNLIFGAAMRGRLDDAR